jgi:hypothetical protein
VVEEEGGEGGVEGDRGLVMTRKGSGFDLERLGSGRPEQNKGEEWATGGGVLAFEREGRRGRGKEGGEELEFE